MLEELGLNDGYVDVPGLCRNVSIDEIEAHGWSLNPGRYVGVASSTAEEHDFTERLETLAEEFEVLSQEADELRAVVTGNIVGVLE